MYVYERGIQLNWSVGCQKIMNHLIIRCSLYCSNYVTNIYLDHLHFVLRNRDESFRWMSKMVGCRFRAEFDHRNSFFEVMKKAEKHDYGTNFCNITAAKKTQQQQTSAESWMTFFFSRCFVFIFLISAQPNCNQWLKRSNREKKERKI